MLSHVLSSEIKETINRYVRYPAQYESDKKENEIRLSEINQILTKKQLEYNTFYDSNKKEMEELSIDIDPFDFKLGFNRLQNKNKSELKKNNKIIDIFSSDITLETRHLPSNSKLCKKAVKEKVEVCDPVHWLDEDHCEMFVDNDAFELYEKYNRFQNDFITCRNARFKTKYCPIEGGTTPEEIAGHARSVSLNERQSSICKNEAERLYHKLSSMLEFIIKKMSTEYAFEKVDEQVEIYNNNMIDEIKKLTIIKRRQDNIRKSKEKTIASSKAKQIVIQEQKRQYIKRKQDKREQIEKQEKIEKEEECKKLIDIYTTNSKHIENGFFFNKYGQLIPRDNNYNKLMVECVRLIYEYIVFEGDNRQDIIKIISEIYPSIITEVLMKDFSTNSLYIILLRMYSDWNNYDQFGVIPEEALQINILTLLQSYYMYNELSNHPTCDSFQGVKKEYETKSAEEYELFKYKVNYIHMLTITNEHLLQFINLLLTLFKEKTEIIPNISQSVNNQFFLLEIQNVKEKNIKKEYIETYRDIKEYTQLYINITQLKYYIIIGFNDITHIINEPKLLKVIQTILTKDFENKYKLEKEEQEKSGKKCKRKSNFKRNCKCKRNCKPNCNCKRKSSNKVK